MFQRELQKNKNKPEKPLDNKSEETFKWNRFQ